MTASYSGCCGQRRMGSLKAYASRLIEEKNGRFQLANFYPPLHRRTMNRIRQAKNEDFLIKFWHVVGC